MKEKILLISPQPFFQWRGSPIRVAFNAEALAKLGYCVDLLTLPIGEDKTIEGVNIIRVANPLHLRNIPIGPSVPKVFFDALLLLKGVSLCLRNRYTVIHGVEEAGFIGVILSKLFNTYAIFEKHSDPFSYKKGFLKNCLLRLYAEIEKISVKMSDAVICTGPGLIRQVEEMGTTTEAFHIFDIPSSLVESDPNGVLAVHEELKKTQNDVLITFVGSFALYQGVELMFAAIPEVIKKCPHARFVIIGGSAKEIEAHKKQFAGLGIGHRVNFLGKIAPDLLPNNLRASDILLSPRASGVNSPLKILDYMKAGRSIVATDIPSNRLILNESNAVLTEPVPKAFANGIISLVEDEQGRQIIGNKNYELYQTKYTFDHYCKLIKTCYSTVRNSSLCLNSIFHILDEFSIDFSTSILTIGSSIV